MVGAKTAVSGFSLPLYEFNHVIRFFELLKRVPHGIAIVVPLNPLLKKVRVNYF